MWTASPERTLSRSLHSVVVVARSAEVPMTMLAALLAAKGALSLGDARLG
jgi:hypothetical protein